MKKLQILLPMAAVLLSLTGCKKDNEKSGPSGETVTLSATLGGGEKTEIYNETKMKWSDGDEVNINGTPCPATFGVSHETAFFNVEASTDGYEAIYPASIYKGSMSGELPQTQTYHPENVNKLSDISPMYAEIKPDTETTELQFHHICALVKLEVTGTGIVKQIVVTSFRELCGTFDISESDGKFFAQIMDGEKSVTLDCSEDGGVTLDPETPKTFYIALPQGTIEDLTFKCCGDDGVWTSQPIATANLTAGKLYTKSLENVEMKPGFSVSATTIVEFAPGNLWYDGSAFHFETNQWDTKPAYSETDEGSGTWDANHVSHFKWSDMPGAVSDDYDYSGSGELFCKKNFIVDGDSDWRTLSSDEWNYLLGYDPEAGQTATYGRPNAMNLCAWKELDGGTHNGLVILPDGTENPSTVMDGITTTSDLGSSGAVFLPAAGCRFGTDVWAVGSDGYYWSSTSYEDGEELAYDMEFWSSGVRTYYVNRGSGYAVRLVR